MKNARTLALEARGGREIVMTRVFDAPRSLVWDAFTQPGLVKQWLLGPPGWSMPVCEIDLGVGGRYRYLWRHANGNEMGMGGVHREIVVPERIVATGSFGQSWYPGEAVGTIVPASRAGKTTLTQTLLYESQAAREVVLRPPMQQGVAMGYDRLAELVASLSARRDRPARA
jgi:uncharacterized protein YndB with AHSA1/START domain